MNTLRGILDNLSTGCGCFDPRRGVSGHRAAIQVDLHPRLPGLRHVRSGARATMLPRLSAARRSLVPACVYKCCAKQPVPEEPQDQAGAHHEDQLGDLFPEREPGEVVAIELHEDEPEELNPRAPTPAARKSFDHKTGSLLEHQDHQRRAEEPKRHGWAVADFVDLVDHGVAEVVERAEDVRVVGRRG